MCRLAVVDTQLEQARVQVALAVAQHSLVVARHVQLDLVVAQYRLAVSQYRLADAQREWTVEELEQARASSKSPCDICEQNRSKSYDIMRPETSCRCD